MHEWALADAIVNSSLKLAKDKGLPKVNEIFIRIGEVNNIDIDAFNFALSEIMKGTILENSKIIFNEIQANLKCNNCGFIFNYKNEFDKLSEDEKESIHFIPETVHIYIRCPNCGSVDFDFIEGRGIFLEDIKWIF